MTVTLISFVYCIVKDFKEVMEALRNVTEWSILSILLGVKESTLRHIYKDNEGHAYQAEQAIVEAWLGDTDEPSWAMLVTALQDDLVGMNGIGKKIGKQHSSECMVIETCEKRFIHTINQSIY